MDQKMKQKRKQIIRRIMERINVTDPDLLKLTFDYRVNMFLLNLKAVDPTADIKGVRDEIIEEYLEIRRKYGRK